VSGLISVKLKMRRFFVRSKKRIEIKVLKYVELGCEISIKSRLLSIGFGGVLIRYRQLLLVVFGHWIV
jgi:hypothetical protein